MSSGIYDIIREKIFSKEVDLLNDSVLVLLVGTGYTPDFTNDRDISDIPEDFILSSQLLLGKRLEEGYFKANTVVFTGIENAVSLGGILLGFAPSFLWDGFFFCFYTLFTYFAISISYYHKAIDLWVDYSVLLDNPVSIVDTKQGTVLINRTTKFQVNEYILKHAILKGDLIKLNGIEYIVAGYTSNGVGIISFWVNNAV